VWCPKWTPAARSASSVGVFVDDCCCSAMWCCSSVWFLVTSASVIVPTDWLPSTRWRLGEACEVDCGRAVVLRCCHAEERSDEAATSSDSVACLATKSFRLGPSLAPLAQDDNTTLNASRTGTAFLPSDDPASSAPPPARHA